MATQVQTLTDGAQEKAQGAQKTVEGASGTVQGYTSGILSSINGIASSVMAWAQGILDRFFPPEQRAAVLARVQEFMLSNPKLSTFLGMNIFLTGIPLFLFILFSITVLIFSLVVGLVLGLLAAVVFTLFCVGVALTIVLPFVFFTTMTACFLFLWGLGGYYILKWANNKSGGTSDEPGLLSSGSIGDSLNNLTGGRLTGFMDAAKAQNAKGDISGFSDQHTKPEPQKEKQQNGSAEKQPQQKPQKQSVGVSETSPLPSSTRSLQGATKATGLANPVKKSANATGTVKSGLRGVSGFT